MKLIIGILLLIGTVCCEVYLRPGFENAVPALELPHNKEMLDKIYPNYKRDNSRITNGWPAYRGQFPYQVYMYLVVPPYTSFCGGTFIKYNWVLTASHCLEGVTELNIYGGMINRQTGPYDWTQYVNEKRFMIMHEMYNNPIYLRNDVALVFMRSATPHLFDQNPNMAPIELPTRNDANIELHGYMGTISGFGEISDRVTTYELHYTTVGILSNNYCTPYFGDYVHTSNVCIDTYGGYSTCSGDSGGPLVTTINNRKVQVGITSFGSSSGCTLGIPSVFARVTSFLDWIDNKIANPPN